jgi:hypothetical protein
MTGEPGATGAPRPLADEVAQGQDALGLEELERVAMLAWVSENLTLGSAVGFRAADLVLEPRDLLRGRPGRSLRRVPAQILGDEAYEAAVRDRVRAGRDQAPDPAGAGDMWTRQYKRPSMPTRRRHAIGLKLEVARPRTRSARRTHNLTSSWPAWLK